MPPTVSHNTSTTPVGRTRYCLLRKAPMGLSQSVCSLGGSTVTYWTPWQYTAVALVWWPVFKARYIINLDELQQDIVLKRFPVPYFIELTCFWHKNGWLLWVVAKTAVAMPFRWIASQLRKTWIARIQREGSWSPSGHSKVCSVHFPILT